MSKFSGIVGGVEMSDMKIDSFGGFFGEHIQKLKKEKNQIKRGEEEKYWWSEIATTRQDGSRNDGCHGLPRSPRRPRNDECGWSEIPRLRSE